MERFEYSQDFKESSINEALDKLSESIKNLPQDRKEELKRLMEEKRS